MLRPIKRSEYINQISINLTQNRTKNKHFESCAFDSAISYGIQLGPVLQTKKLKVNLTNYAHHKVTEVTIKTIDGLDNMVFCHLYCNFLIILSYFYTFAGFKPFTFDHDTFCTLSNNIDMQLLFFSIKIGKLGEYLVTLWIDFKTTLYELSHWHDTCNVRMQVHACW